MFSINTLTLKVLLLNLGSLSACGSYQAQTLLRADGSCEPILSFNKTWHSLGPFRIGTREAVWGSDPLEAVGGFRNIHYDESATFASPLVANATVQWESHDLSAEYNDTDAAVHFDVSHSTVDWTFERQGYGWSALQYQTWIRGRLINHKKTARRVWLFSERILEFYINDEHFFGGDFFTFNRAPALITLLPGPNVIDVRLVRDIRSMGGDVPPTIYAALRARLMEEKPEIDFNSTIAPDMVDGKIPTPYFGFPIRNPLSNWITVYDCSKQASEYSPKPVKNVIEIGPGQTRLMGFVLSDVEVKADRISGTLCYLEQDKSREQKVDRLPFFFKLNRKNSTAVSKLTYLHSSGSVSFAMLRPPLLHSRKSQIPILLILHGAGVEADNPISTHALDELPDLQSFVIWPSGMSPWSGDDWHMWGNSDALRAIDAIPGWIETMGWSDISVSTDRVVVAGHSNGGQGIWYWVTHLPDRTIAAASLSGYSSIETYVTYNMWREADPLKTSILNIARISYRHELLLDNLAWIPILQQQGSADDNVPPYNGRLMSSLRSEAFKTSEYIEYAGMPHWWEGVVTTEPLQRFYREHLKTEDLPRKPDGNFSAVIPATGEIGSKFGIVVDQLQSPDYLGHINVHVHDIEGGQHWHLLTTNIHRLHFDFRRTSINPPVSVTIDTKYRVPPENTTATIDRSCVRDDEGAWVCSYESWGGLEERYGKQRGALDAIMRSQGSFQIVSCVDNLHLALQVSRNLFQYYRADTVILPCEKYDAALEQPGNVILIAKGESSVPKSQLPDFPIMVNGGNISLRTRVLRRSQTIPHQPEIGAVFLRPLPNERLELVIWGTDSSGLTHAARLAPSLTGAGQPDFVVFGPKARLQGHGGAIAMGFFDFRWNISLGSYVP